LQLLSAKLRLDSILKAASETVFCFILKQDIHLLLVSAFMDWLFYLSKFSWPSLVGFKYFLCSKDLVLKTHIERSHNGTESDPQ